MLRLKPTNQTPPDFYTYKFQDGYTIRAVGYDEWWDKIKKYASDNNYPVPSVEEAEDALCRRLSGEWCSGGDEYSFVSTRFTLDDFLRGMKTLGEFVLKGQVVSPEMAEARGMVCSRCPLNTPVPGCASCVGLANAVVAIKGAKSTKHDHLLKVCSVCLCSNEAQIWLPIDSLAKSTTPEMMEKYRRVGECWKKNELEDYGISKI